MPEQDRVTVPLRCRPMTAGDYEGVIALLARRFPARDATFWAEAVHGLARHTAAQNFPHHGFVLVSGSEVVGALLMIFSRLDRGDQHPALRCNLSSWCVEEAFRSYAPLLVNAATRDKSVTYVNVSPEVSTRPTIEAQGFRRYCDTLLFAAPLLAGPTRERVRCLDGNTAPRAPASDEDIDLMRSHAAFDCLRFWCETKDGAYPFIFVVGRRIRNLVTAAHVVYCPSPELVARFAWPLGQALAKRGIFVLTLDAQAPVPGLRGWLKTDVMPKYFKGPHEPRLGDLAYTEQAVLGV